MNAHMAAVEVTDAQTGAILTAARELLARRGLARGGYVQRIPGRAFGELPISVEAALNVAAGHGPYPGCLAPDCARCLSADAARHALARHLHDGPPPADSEADAAVIEHWIDHLRPSEAEAEVLAAIDAAAESGDTR